MKKQKVQFILLVVLLVVLIGAYFGVDKYTAYVENKAAEEELLSKIYVAELDAVNVEALTFEYNGESNSFVKEDGVWVYEEDKSLEIEQSKIEAMAEAFANLTAESKIEGVTDLEQYGLTEPSRTLSFTADGAEHVWHIGNMNDLTYVYYMYDEADESTVYTITSGFLSNFNYGIKGLVAEEETSETEAESVTTETETMETSAETETVSTEIAE